MKILPLALVALFAPLPAASAAEEPCAMEATVVNADHEMQTENTNRGPRFSNRSRNVYF